MAKQYLREKTVLELRTMAKKAGVIAKRGWKKKDFVKALSPRKKSSAKTAVKKSPVYTLPPLPAEYKEDKIVPMQVTPRRIYVYWEIPEDKLVKYKGSLNIKVSVIKTDAFFYTPISGRIGESFVNIDPDNDCAIEIGIIDHKGEFINISRPEPTAHEFSAEKPAEGPPEEIAPVEQSEKTEPEQEKASARELFEMPEPATSY
jgi:hypothetical protein